MRLKAEDYFAKLDSVRTELSAFLDREYIRQHLNPETREKAMAQHIEGRSRFFINGVLPWVGQFAPLEDLSFVEFGPGTGSTTAPLAISAKSVDAYDISHVSADVAIKRCELLGLKNVSIHIEESGGLLEKVLSRHSKSKVDAVMMFAVLEHMKIRERQSTLEVAWQILKDGGLLVIGDTPNRLTYQNGHTSRHPFFDMVPDELMLQYADKFDNAPFAEAVKTWVENGESADAIRDRIDRWGRGMSFHEVELALGGELDMKIIADGLEKSMVRAIPLTRIEVHLMRYLNDELPHIPLGFGRSSLYLIFQKAVPNAASKRRWDETLVRALLKA